MSKSRMRKFDRVVINRRVPECVILRQQGASPVLKVKIESLLLEKRGLINRRKNRGFPL